MGIIVPFQTRRAKKDSGGPCSSRMREVIRMFGVQERREISKVDVQIPIAPGEIVLITGPSGCGKTTILKSLRQNSSICNLIIRHNNADRRALVDQFHMPLCDTLALLAKCGLSEAGILLLRPDQLSQGQRYRFELARCLASPEPVIVADEFCSVLDRTVACILCWQMRKLVPELHKTLIAATAHEDIAQDLSPDHWLHMDLGGQAVWQKGGSHVQCH